MESLILRSGLMTNTERAVSGLSNLSLLVGLSIPNFTAISRVGSANNGKSILVIVDLLCVMTSFNQVRCDAKDAKLLQDNAHTFTHLRDRDIYPAANAPISVLQTGV